MVHGLSKDASLSAPQVLDVGDGWDEFIEFSWTLHREDPSWIPPIRAALRADLEGGAAGPGGETLGLLAKRDGDLIGRMAATMRPHLAIGGMRVGQLGFIECENDPEAFDALVAAGTTWLAERGAELVVAPMNGGAHRLHRVMTHGHDHPPFAGEPRNAPYMPGLLQSAGMQPIHTWHGTDATTEEIAPLADVLKRMARRTQSMHTEQLDVRDPQRTLARIHKILDSVWEGHVGYVPFSAEEFAEIFAPILALMPSDAYCQALVDSDGRDVGGGFMYPDWSEQIRALNGDAQGWGSWVGGSLPPRLVLHTFAIMPHVRQSAAGAVLLSEGLEQCINEGYESLVLALTTQDLHFYSRFLEPTRRYALMGRSLLAT